MEKQFHGNAGAAAGANQVPRDAFVPLEYSPGEAIQVDWGEARIILGGKKLTINIWCMRNATAAM